MMKSIYLSSGSRNEQLVFAFIILFVLGLSCRKGDARRPTPPPVSFVQQAVTTKTNPLGDASPGTVRFTEDPGGRTRCAKVCEIARRAGCRKLRECLENCVAMTTLPACTFEVVSFLDCLVLQPASNWECDAEGVGSVRDPYCAAEQAKLVACSEAHLAK